MPALKERGTEAADWQLGSNDKVTFGDGSTLQATEEGTVDADMVPNNGTRIECVIKCCMSLDWPITWSASQSSSYYNTVD